ncbi:ribosomal maturation YjgA family protein [Longispora urticae]
MTLTPRTVRLLAVASAAAFLAVALAIRAVSVVGGTIEQISGTALYGSIIYAATLFLRPRSSPLVAGVVAVGFCWLVELAQLTHIPAALSRHSLVARVVLGVRFDPADLAWYPAGIIPLVVLHWWARAGERRPTPPDDDGAGPDLQRSRDVLL